MKIRFSNTELQQLAIAWLVLGLCFSIRYFFFAPQLFAQYFLIALISLGAGFIGHELAHKFVAQHFGYQAEFRLWWLGLILAAGMAVLTQGQFFFAAPGAVYILSVVGRRQEGYISVAGVLANLTLAVAFFLLAEYPPVQRSFFWASVATTGLLINLWLGAFNLLPIPPLDGRKIMSWNLPLWILLLVVFWGSVLFFFFQR